MEGGDEVDLKGFAAGFAGFRRMGGGYEKNSYALDGGGAKALCC